MHKSTGLVRSNSKSGRQVHGLDCLVKLLTNTLKKT